MFYHFFIWKCMAKCTIEVPFLSLLLGMQSWKLNLSKAMAACSQLIGWCTLAKYERYWAIGSIPVRDANLRYLRIIPRIITGWEVGLVHPAINGITLEIGQHPSCYPSRFGGFGRFADSQESPPFGLRPKTQSMKTGQRWLRGPKSHMHESRIWPKSWQLCLCLILPVGLNLVE